MNSMETMASSNLQKSDAHFANTDVHYKSDDNSHNCQSPQNENENN